MFSPTDVEAPPVSDSLRQRFEQDRPSPHNNLVGREDIFALNNLFLLRQDNWHFIRGSHARIGSAFVNYSFIVLAVLLALFAFVMLTSTLVWRYNLDRYGVQGEATLISRRFTTGKNSSYYAKYTYTVGNVAYTREDSVTRRVYNLLPQSGSVLPIEYIPHAPQNVRLGGIYKDDSKLPMQIGFGVLVIGGALAVSIFLIRKDEYEKLISREGQFLIGGVDSCQGSTYKGNFSANLVYRFVSPETGREIVKKDSQVRNDLKKGGLPRPNTPVVVLYLDDKRFKVM